MHNFYKQAFTMKRFMILFLTPLALLSCSGDHSVRNSHRDAVPQWFYIGWSCAKKSPFTGASPICGQNRQNATLYAGFTMLSDTNPDGWCGDPDGKANSLDIYLTRGITDTTLIEAARCIIAGAERVELYRCSSEKSGCYCLYSYQFKSRSRFDDLVEECSKKHPPHHP